MVPFTLTYSWKKRIEVFVEHCIQKGQTIIFKERMIVCELKSACFKYLIGVID